MAEALGLRVKRLISGGVYGLIDSVEKAAAEPVMREAIRELERAIEDVRQEFARTVAAGHHAARRVALAKAKIEELSEKARFAVDQHRDDLAQIALSRQMDIEAEVPAQQKTLDDATAKQAELDGYISALNGRKREMEADLAAYRKARREALQEGGSDPAASHRASVERRAEDAQSAFDRAFNAAAGVPDVTRPDSTTTAKLNELDSMSRQVRVAQRLATLKAASTGT